MVQRCLKRANAIRAGRSGYSKRGTAVPGTLDLDHLRDLVDSGEIDTVIAAFTDMQGRLVGKRTSARYFLDAVHEEWHACNYLLTVDMEMEPVPGFASASWDKGYGDFVIKPDLGTLRLLPWLEGTALVLGDVADHKGKELAVSPRAILKRQLERLAARDLSASMASELEFYVFDESYRSAHAKHYRDLQTAGWYIEDYHVFETTKREPLMRRVRNSLEGAGIPVQESKGEWGPGQHELNVVYAEALEMADRHVILKNAIKEMAWQLDRSVTFMAKWRQDLAGNSCHVHQSLWRSGKSAFYDENDPEGFSELMRSWLAGLLAYGRDITYFLAPLVNSYKRFQALSFAPTSLSWSHDNRTTGFRVVGHGSSQRVECRMGGADLNPYLAFAAMIAAGLRGVEEGLPLPPAFRGDAYKASDVPSLPKTLHEALDLLEGSAVLREALGEDVVAHYLHSGRWEQAQADSAVTDWELTRYFERG
jgi:glutamine synthetase